MIPATEIPLTGANLFVFPQHPSSDTHNQTSHVPSQ